MNALTHIGTPKAHQQDKNKATTKTTASTQQQTKKCRCQQKLFIVTC